MENRINQNRDNYGKLIVVVGGQTGSEAKGKLVQHLCSTLPVHLALRTGGINAGHTVGWTEPLKDDGQGNAVRVHRKYVTRSLPSGIPVESTLLGIGAGAIIEPSLLRKEIAELISLGRPVQHRLFIDPNAFIMEESDAVTEAGWWGEFGSTQTGTGAAAVRRIRRAKWNGVQVKDVVHLLPSGAGVTEIGPMAVDQIKGGKNVLVEGTQGFGLSLYHGPWPKCTSRDTTAANFLAECALPPNLVTDTFMVVRSYPIRVAGESGPMFDECQWSDVARESNRPEGAPRITEMTSVTKRVRRVGRWDWDLYFAAISANNPDAVALHGADYLEYGDLGKKKWSELSMKTRVFIDEMEDRGGVEVRWIFTGPKYDEMIDRSLGL